MKQLLFVTAVALLLSGQAVRSVRNTPPAFSAEEFQWSASAECDPHEDVKGPALFLVSFVFNSMASGVDTQTFLSYDKGGAAGELAIRTKWDFPERRWVSSIFEGPRITGHLYCYGPARIRELSFSYYPKNDFRVFLSKDGDFSAKELGTIGAPASASLTVEGVGEFKTVFAAGKGTPVPFWLQFSIPLHTGGSKETSIEYSFR